MLKGSEYPDGLRGSRFYRIWAHVKTRCTNSNHPQYNRYGGRGIKYCEEWETFGGFYKDMYKKYEGLDAEKNKLSLDRINNDQGYHKNNCRWATHIQQANNKSNNIILKYKGEKKPINYWAKQFGLTRATILGRMEKLGWGIEKTLNTPQDHKCRLLTYNGDTKSIADWARELEIDAKQISNRLNRLEWSVEKTLSTPINKGIKRG